MIGASGRPAGGERTRGYYVAHGAVTLLTTPPATEGEPTIERAQATLPWETTRTLSSKSELHLIATSPECRRITCTFVVDGREVTRAAGTPWQERGATTTCLWRAP